MKSILYLFGLISVFLLFAAPTCAQIKADVTPQEQPPAAAPTPTPTPEKKEPPKLVTATEDRSWLVYGVIQSYCHDDNECVEKVFVCFSQADPALSIANYKKLQACEAEQPRP